MASNERSAKGFVKPISGNDRAVGGVAASDRSPTVPARTPTADDATNYSWAKPAPVPDFSDFSGDAEHVVHRVEAGRLADEE